MAKRSRRTNVRKLLPKVYLFSEDAVTGPLYLRALFRSNSGVRLEVSKSGAVPTTLLEGAKQRQAGSLEENDRVWVIFDRDDHPKVDQVVNECLQTDIVLGYSNPCFELWLLYHYQEHDAPDNRHELKKKLIRVCEGYCARGKKLTDASELMGLIDAAIVRADNSITRRRDEGKPHGKPSSTMANIIRDFKSFA